MKNFTFKIPIIVFACFFSISLINCAKEADKVTPIKIVANNFLTQGKIHYKPENIMDNSSRPWCVSKATSMPSFSIIFKEKVKIETVHLMNGFARNDLYLKNKRMAKLTLTNEDNDKIVISIPDEKESNISLQRTLSGNRFTFTVNETYNGTLYEDLCLTEMSFSKEDFNGFLYYDAACNFFEQDFEQIILMNRTHWGEDEIRIFPNGQLDVRVGTTAIERNYHATGKWKKNITEKGSSIEGIYVVKKDDYDSDYQFAYEIEEPENGFSINLVSNKNCNKLDERTVKILPKESHYNLIDLKRGDILIWR